MPDKPATFNEMPEGTVILTKEGTFVKQNGEMVSQEPQEPVKEE